MNRVLAILRERSKESLELAQKHVLSMRIESPRVCEALRYYVESWKDTTHPGSLSLACEAVGGDLTETVPIQAVVLLLSAGMDIHDDIIDESIAKNGRTTLYGKYGKDVAVLIGDALLVEGLTILYRWLRNLKKEISDRISSIVEETFFEVGNAHLLEMDLQGRLDVSPNDYLNIIKRKASILASNIRIGAVLGGGSKNEISALEVYAKNFGILVFLREEFIDTFEPGELGNRLRNEILPLPLLLAFEEPERKRKILEILFKQIISDEDAMQVVKYTLGSQRVRDLRHYIKELAKEALNAIHAKLKDPRATEILELLIEGSLEEI
jgi:geranylgeranyl pyrophosphate synthase